MATRFSKVLLLLLPLLWSLWASPAWPAAIEHPFVAQNTPQSTTNTSYVDVPGTSIADTEFEDGKQYWIVVTGHIEEDSTGFMWMQTVHGSTAFEGSEVQLQATGSSSVWNYMFQTVWTAVAGEGLKLQFKVSGTTATVTADRLAITTMNLTDDLVEGTDWCFNQRTNNDSLSTTPTDGGSCTITPSGASDWLVESFANHDATSTTTTSISRIVRSGEASSTLPEARVLLDNTSQLYSFGTGRVFALTAVSNTFKEQSEASASANTRLYSNIFMLNLNKFAARAHQYTEGDVVLTATNYETNIATASITPTVTGDVWIGAYFGGDTQNTGRRFEYRVQVDDSDQPTGQTTDNYQFGPGTAVGGTGDEIPFNLTTMANLSNAAHTIDLDASINNITDSPAAQHRAVWAFTMELASAASPNSGIRRRSF